MLTPVILGELAQALKTMYSNAPQAAKKESTVYLESFQKSEVAWEVCHQILSDASIDDTRMKLFAAQTLRSKVTYDVTLLPESSFPSLRSSLLQVFIIYNRRQDKLIRTQLSIALSLLMLQDLSWTNATEDIIDHLSNPNLVLCLLDFLKILPEELSDVKRTSLTDEEFNDRTAELIESKVEKVLLILKTLSESTSDSLMKSSILDCLNSWIKEFPISDLLSIDSLTNLVFQSLLSPNSFDKAIECLVTILRETRDINDLQLIDALFQQVIKINTFMPKEMTEDPEVVDGLTRLYSEAGESWHVLIAKDPNHFKPLIDLILQCCSYEEDLDVVKYTFYFWHLLKQLVTLPKFEKSKAELVDTYSSLITVIIKHLTYPTDAEDHDLFDGDKEQEDKFKEFRYEMGDLLKDCCAVVGPTRALNIPFQQVQSCLRDPNSQKWQYIEAPLFSMRTMAKEVPLTEQTILPTIMEFLVQLPEHPKIRYAATLVLGRYTEWTSKNPSFLEPQLQYITKGFEMDSSKEIIMATSQTLMYFCQDCSKYLVNYLEQLYVLYGRVQDKIDLSSSYELADGLGHVIKQVPRENVYQTLEMFLSPHLNYFTALLSAPQTEELCVEVADKIEVITIFDSVLRSAKFEDPDYPPATFFMEKIWPLLEKLLEKFGLSLKVSERVLKSIRTAIQSFSTYLSPILSSLASLLHEGFKKSRYGCFLWVTGALVREFGDEYSSEDVKENVYNFGLSQAQTFFEIFNAYKQEGRITEINDVVEDFFRMMDDLLMFFPFKLIGNSELLSSLKDAAVVTISSIREFETLIACLHFMIDLISWGLPNPPISFFDENPHQVQEQIKALLMTSGVELIKCLIEGLIFLLPNDAQHDANDLLLKVLVVIPDSQLAIEWLVQVVMSLPNVSEKEVNKLGSTISVALPNKDNRRVRSSLKDFISWYSRKNVSPRSEF
ncbi:Nuclear import receptor [Scheffersomyces spartinae]|uniref:Nuclear import receptor n=1 Tax=Scheffersomyces spartinae TaxID=45513 RepID=A0A9P7VDQ6_9ASCO|nr:Nuclear import receptor [Scheffersomyces spartinae]KAG7195608.1 Nuclear import receptor [Scheffersomyces spartinae]